MDSKRKNAFSLVELIMTMAVITVLSVGGAYTLIFLVQSAIFIPGQLNADMLASDAVEIMIEGDDQARGLRFSRSVNDIKPLEITFNNQDGQSVRYWLDGATERLYRSINGGPGSLIPYYVPAAGVSLEGPAGQVFSYFDGAGAVTNDAASVRRIDLAIEATTGTGFVDDGGARTALSSGVAVNRY